MQLTDIQLVTKCHLGGVGRFLRVQPNVAAQLIRDGLAEKVEKAHEPKRAAPVAARRRRVVQPT